MKNKNLVILITASIAAILIIIGGIWAFYAIKSEQKTKEAATAQPSGTAATSTLPVKKFVPLTDSQLQFECLNLSADSYKSCRDKLNVELTSQNAQELKNVCLGNAENVKNFLLNNKNANFLSGKQVVYPSKTTTPDIGEMIQTYLVWEAALKNDQSICQKLNFYNGSAGSYGSSTINGCVNIVQTLNFVENLYKKNSTCKTLCQKADKVFTSASDCSTFCQAVKSNSADGCSALEEPNGRLTCKAIVSFDPASCENVIPRYIASQEEGKPAQEDMLPICQRAVYMYNAVKQNNEDLLNEAYKVKKFAEGGDVEYLDKIYFQKDASDNGFSAGYANYCNSKYSL